MKVGFIGIGNMGWPMAANLVRKGHEVTVFDRDGERAPRFALEHQARAATTFGQVAESDFVITMLPDGKVVRRVLLEEDGGGLAKRLRPGTIVIDMSSSDPVGTRDLGPPVAACGAILLDAPVSGAVPRAVTGTLAIMIGGADKAAIEKAKPVLACMGDRLFETGPLGSGHAMKALNNFIAAAGLAAAIEALLVGERFGLDPGLMTDILNVSSGKNFATELLLRQHIISGEFRSGFQLGLLAKDVRIAAELGKAVAVNAPVLQLVSDRFDAARDKLGYTRDNTAAILAWKDENTAWPPAAKSVVLAACARGSPGPTGA